jgi:hypothetical protein
LLCANCQVASCNVAAIPFAVNSSTVKQNQSIKTSSYLVLVWSTFTKVQTYRAIMLFSLTLKAICFDQAAFLAVTADATCACKEVCSSYIPGDGCWYRNSSCPSSFCKEFYKVKVIQNNHIFYSKYVPCPVGGGLHSKRFSSLLSRRGLLLSLLNSKYA